MGTTGNINYWDKINQGVRETDRLINQKQFNVAMIKTRQTLEYMVKYLAERACIVEGDLMDNIDELYQGRWITKSTCEHFHKIRIIGNKAAHEGNDNSIDAGQAFQLLTQEVRAFSNDSGGKARSSSSRPAPARSQSSRTSGNNSSRRRKGKRGFTIYTLLKLIIAVLVVVLIILLVKFITPVKDIKETTVPATTQQESTTSSTEATTHAPATTAPAAYKTTTDGLRVRSEPNSENNNVLGKLNTGVTVEYIKAYNEEWAIIKYNGQDAYVSSKYLSKVE